MVHETIDLDMAEKMARTWATSIQAPMNLSLPQNIVANEGGTEVGDFLSNIYRNSSFTKPFETLLPRLSKMGSCLSVAEPKPKRKHRHSVKNSHSHHRRPREPRDVVFLTANGWEMKKRHKKRRHRE
ncbi:hypothetical protein FPOAC1_000808 [Fusarium poae]|uniref:hypothetical protein n=1 Tax=Fusarium poae TaxID=36050 RepID=UPI001CEAB941|nr:hypothetical protein FPOAC1_000808 [Fusarium poae]KAG8674836.1 hypothetical protein FPOAC1_000808 [Fusarium poae]